MKQAFYSTNYLFRLYYGQKYRYTDARSGDNMHFIARMRKGHCRIVCRDAEITVPEGGIFYIPEGLSYQSYWYGETEFEFDSFGFWSFPEASESQYALQLLPGNAQIHALMDLIAQEPSICSGTLSKFYALLSALLPQMKVRETKDPAQQILHKAASYLMLHSRAPIADVARHCGVSESGLYNLFRRHGAATPNGLRHSILAQKATHLLQTTNMSIEQISSKLEFSSSSYFRKVVRTATGKTPKQLRREGKQI